MKTTVQSATERESVLTVKELFQNVIVDEIIPHDDIRNIIKQYYPNAPDDLSYGSVRSISATVVRKVRSILNEETGAVFVCVNSKGYRRLSQANGVAYAGKNPLVRTRRFMRRSYKQLSNALRNSNDISAEDRLKATQQMSRFGLIEYLTLDKTVEMMPEIPSRTDPLQPLRDSLGI